MLGKLTSSAHSGPEAHSSEAEKGQSRSRLDVINTQPVRPENVTGKI